MLAAENAAAVRGEVKGVVSSWVGVVACGVALLKFFQK